MTRRADPAPEPASTALAVPHLKACHLQETGAFSAIDIHFARLMARLGGTDDPDLLLSAAAVSFLTGQGHVCFDLRAHPAALFPAELHPLFTPAPDAAALEAKLAGLSVVGQGDDAAPLVLNSGRLYLQKYWKFERDLADLLRKRAFSAVDIKEPDRLKSLLATLFDRDGEEGPDLQQAAAFCAATRLLTVVTGGPGTGKTTTIAKILGVLLGLSDGAPRIALAAPTGKAAARMAESLRRVIPSLALAQEARAQLPDQTFTLHRLLGVLPHGQGFGRNPANPLPYDVVIVDEASMIDLPLMYRLLSALGEGTRLVLLGDKDQLASVEAGAVLADICSGSGHGFSRAFRERFAAATGTALTEERDGEGGLADSVVALRRSYRFGKTSGIGSLAAAVTGGDADAALGILASDRYEDLRWVRPVSRESLAATLEEQVLPLLTPAVLAREPKACFDAHNALRILSPLRQGPYGTDGLNSKVERLLRARGALRGVGPDYPGKPVMILRNDYTVRLFNGDMGVYLQTGRELQAFFPTEDGFRSLVPARLPEHDTVYAMTVHKSQGSEFDRIVLVLPDRDSPLLTRELLYTALTRAREHVTVIADEAIFRRAVRRVTRRTSGLREALWGKGSG